MIYRSTKLTIVFIYQIGNVGTWSNANWYHYVPHTPHCTHRACVCTWVARPLCMRTANKAGIFAREGRNISDRDSVTDQRPYSPCGAALRVLIRQLLCALRETPAWWISLWEKRAKNQKRIERRLRQERKGKVWSIDPTNSKRQSLFSRTEYSRFSCRSYCSGYTRCVWKQYILACLCAKRSCIVIVALYAYRRECTRDMR